ncbi:MAG: helix-turn-helix domain-containing protein [Anaerolineae bacterium]|nr:helix-turn-helix domain-containing protein [Anaerolineae bacterium]
MPKRFQESLTTAQREELENCRDHHQKAYMREKAAAILKIADGHTGSEVARRLLLKRRDEDTVYSWWHNYHVEGLAGLSVKAGRGRKPAFSPSLPDGGAGA